MGNYPRLQLITSSDRDASYTGGGEVEASWIQTEETMRGPLYTPSSVPVVEVPGPLLLFIKQAQIALVYASDR